MTIQPSWIAYSTLRSLCILHGVEVQDVSRRTLYNWRASGVDFDHIDLLALRLHVAGHLSSDAIRDIYCSAGYFSVASLHSCFVKCRAPGLS